jgi:alpha-beta hydrolase superfamily lysophospholipase
MKFIIFTLVTMIFTTTVNAETKFLSYGTLKVHYGLYESTATKTVGDVLYFHGYGDTFENHQPLFKEFNRQGLRVIAFDLPSHGKTTGNHLDDLDWYSFSKIAEIASYVRLMNLGEFKRPLFLAGWSTGGLIATRIVQSEAMSSLFPTIKGVITYAPGVAVKTCVGDSFCQITNETLTHNQNLQERSIYPESPLYRVNFATKLLLQVHTSWKEGVPSHIPTLVFVAGENEDRYVKSKEIKEWVRAQRSKYSSEITAFNCANARHELDNEPDEFGGSQVRLLSADFVRSIIDGRSPKSVQGPCQSF